MVSKFQKDLRTELKKIEKQFDKGLNTKTMKKLGDESVKMIRTRTKLGYGVSVYYEGNIDNTNNKRTRLKSLSFSYIRQRQRLRAQGKLDNTTTPKKSNLTKTGQMLRNLRVSSAKKSEVILKTTGRRYDSKYSNEQIADFVSQGGRPWLDLTNNEQKKLARYYQNNILKPLLAKV